MEQLKQLFLHPLTLERLKLATGKPIPVATLENRGGD
jgi:hypothetical protein